MMMKQGCKSSCLARISKTMLIIAFLTFDEVSACHLHEQQTVLRPAGYETYPLRYNVCVDNTTISSQTPTKVRPERYIFRRECCGCRVSSIFERQLELVNVWPRETNTFYFTDIRACQCIPCNFDQNPHLLPFVELRHKK